MIMDELSAFVRMVRQNVFWSCFQIHVQKANITRYECGILSEGESYCLPLYSISSISTSNSPISFHRNKLDKRSIDVFALRPKSN